MWEVFEKPETREHFCNTRNVQPNVTIFTTKYNQKTKTHLTRHDFALLIIQVARWKARYVLCSPISWVGQRFSASLVIFFCLLSRHHDHRRPIAVWTFVVVVSVGWNSHWALLVWRYTNDDRRDYVSDTKLLSYAKLPNIKWTRKHNRRMIHLDGRETNCEKCPHNRRNLEVSWLERKKNIMWETNVESRQVCQWAAIFLFGFLSWANEYLLRENLLKGLCCMHMKDVYI